MHSTFAKTAQGTIIIPGTDSLELTKVCPTAFSESDVRGEQAIGNHSMWHGQV
jgi:hypothetical protein